MNGYGKKRQCQIKEVENIRTYTCKLWVTGLEVISYGVGYLSLQTDYVVLSGITRMANMPQELTRQLLEAMTG